MSRYGLLILTLLLVPQPFLVADTVINFDGPGITDGLFITNQFPNLVFTNALVQVPGVDLNEFDFPPHSPPNVVIDSGGPIAINFSTPVPGFGGFFTYNVALTLDAFDISNNLVATAQSTFSNNTGTAGDPFSSPNEFLKVDFAGGISEVTITGNPGGNSFALDDATIRSATTAVPEPSAFLLLLTVTLTLTPFSRKLIRF
jgi:hypothetical protein